MAIPGQSLSILDPGLGLVEPSDTIPVYLGVSSLGAPSTLTKLSNKKDVRDQFGEGPLSEAACRELDIAGGPILLGRLANSVLGSFGSVSTTRAGSSTGSVSTGVTPVSATKAWQIDDPSGSPSYVDETADFASAATADVDPWPSSEASGDQFAIGYEAPFNSIEFTLSQNGSSGSIAVKYWDGSAWAAVSGLSDGTSGLTGDGTISFTMPTDWAKKKINSNDELFYLVLEVDGTYATNPVISQGQIKNQGPFDRYEAIVEILKTGTLGAGAFKYSLDDGRSYSEQITIPSSGTFDVPNTGIRLTFAAGGGPTFFEDGDIFEFDTVAPHYSTSDLSAMMDEVESSNESFDFIVLTGRHASTSDGATMFSTLDTKMTALANAKKYARAMMDAGGSDAATAITDYANSASSRIAVVYQDVDLPSSKAYTGWGNPKRPLVESVGARAAAVLVSTDLGRFPDGPISGALALSHDERKNESLDVHKFTTARTYVDASGFYITHGRLMSAQGSDFLYWQHGRVMDLACRTVVQAQQSFINTGFRTNADGTIDERDARRMEETVKDALRAVLKDPLNAEGTKGHVSDFNYTIDRTNDVQSTNTLLTSVAIRPLGYVKTITTTIGFATDVGN